MDGYIIPFVPGSWACKEDKYVVAHYRRVVASDTGCMRGKRFWRLHAPPLWWYRTRHVRVDDGEIWGHRYRGVIVSHHYAMGAWI
jgi:hypothetical protein